LPLVSTKAIDIGQICFHWLDSYSRYSFIQFAYFIKYIRHGLITQYSRSPFFFKPTCVVGRLVTNLSKNRARRVSIYLQYFLREVSSIDYIGLGNPHLKGNFRTNFSFLQQTLENPRQGITPRLGFFFYYLTSSIFYLATQRNWTTW
jgi:hypothetical protein